MWAGKGNRYPLCFRFCLYPKEKCMSPHMQSGPPKVLRPNHDTPRTLFPGTEDWTQERNFPRLRHTSRTRSPNPSEEARGTAGQVSSSHSALSVRRGKCRAPWELIAGRWPDLDGGRLQEHGGWVRSWQCMRKEWDEGQKRSLGNLEGC